MKKWLIRAAALLALVGLVSLGSADALLALAQGEDSCGRACCNLAKAGSVYADSCCRLNCHEEASGPDAGNAFGKDSLQRLLLIPRTPSLRADLANLPQPLTWRAQEKLHSAKIQVGQSDLHLKLSLLLA